MPRVVRVPAQASATRSGASGAPRRTRNSVTDRPSRLKLLLRRQRRLFRPAVWLLALLIVGLGGAVLFSRATPGGLLANLRDRFGRSAASMAGMTVRDIVVQGRANTPEPLLRAALGVSAGDPTLGFSVADARARIESLAWVQHATVERRLPGTILVQLDERRPFALWQHNNKYLLVDRDGQVVADQDLASFRDLPQIVGAGAPAAAARLLDGLRDRPTVATHVLAAVRVGERRWNLRLKSGTDVMLPEGQEVAALDRLQQLQQQDQLLDRPLQFVDMRLPDRLSIRPIAASPDSPPAAKDAAKPDAKPETAPRRPT